MKILTLKLGDKTYTTGKLTAFLAKEVIKIGKQAIDLAKSQSFVENLDENSNTDELEKASKVMDAMAELVDKKTWIICEAFNNKFSPDELEKELSSQEIDEEINRIMSAITGAMQKN